MSASHSFASRPSSVDGSAILAPLPQRFPIGPTPKPTHTRTGSVISSRSRQDVPHAPSSPVAPAFHAGVAPTHMGGILPSASFFRPSRPNYQTPIARPISAASASSSHLGDSVQMTHLDKRISTLSDFSVPDPDEDAMTTSEDLPRQLDTMKRAKPSREPLLPIGSKPTVHKPNLSPVYTLSTNGSRPSLRKGPSERSAGAGMRNSLERMWRGMSFDGQRKSKIAPGSPVELDEGTSPSSALTFEDKTMEDDGNIGPYKHSISPPYQPSLSPSLRHRPEYEFNPVPPPDVPSLMETPMTDPKTGKVMRNYQLHPSKNRFFLGGRVMTGGDQPYAFLGSFALLLIVVGAFFGSTVPWWWHNESPAVAAVCAYLCLLTISTMLATVMRDPGILPRNLDIDPPIPSGSDSDGGLKAPFPRDLKVRAGVVRVKYCPTCRTYRPPRSSHCKMCDNCVDGCDHHCQWVNNCVGRRNYTTFFVFLSTTVVNLILIIVTSALHLWFLTQRDNIDFRHALAKGAGSAIAFVISLLVVWPVTALLAYHLRLLLLNVTTIEQIRNQAHKTLVPGPPPPNPFSHGSMRWNFINVLCRPTGYSWLDPGAIATGDKRKVNPGLAQWEAQDLETGDGKAAAGSP